MRPIPEGLGHFALILVAEVKGQGHNGGHEGLIYIKAQYQLLSTPKFQTLGLPPTGLWVDASAKSRAPADSPPEEHHHQ